MCGKIIESHQLSERIAGTLVAAVSGLVEYI
jgi:hypothetical protein